MMHIYLVFNFTEHMPFYEDVHYDISYAKRIPCSEHISNAERIPYAEHSPYDDDDPANSHLQQLLQDVKQTKNLLFKSCFANHFLSIDVSPGSTYTNKINTNMSSVIFIISYNG